MSDANFWLEILAMIVETFSSLKETLLDPVGSWLPQRISELPLGDAASVFVDYFLAASGIGDFTLVTVLFGAGFSVFIIYTLVTWVLNLVT